MSSTTKAEPKTAPVSKSDLLLDVASEAKILRSSEGISMVLIPNHPTKKRPVSLFDSFDFVCWLTWRCHCKHGFLPSSALINTILRALAGKALFSAHFVGKLVQRRHPARRQRNPRNSPRPAHFR